MPPGWRKVFHLRGEQPCRKAALILIHPLQMGEKYVITNVVRKINGQPVSGEDVVECGSCRYLLHQPHTNTDLDWTPHVVRPTNLSVSFADEHSPPPVEHPIDTFDRMTSNMEFDRDEILHESQRVDLHGEDEIEALRELGEQLSVYTRSIPDAPVEETQSRS